MIERTVADLRLLERLWITGVRIRGEPDNVTCFQVSGAKRSQPFFCGVYGHDGQPPMLEKAWEVINLAVSNPTNNTWEVINLAVSREERRKEDRPAAKGEGEYVVFRGRIIHWQPSQSPAVCIVTHKIVSSQRQVKSTPKLVTPQPAPLPLLPHRPSSCHHR